MQATRAVVLRPARAGEPGALRWADAGLDSKPHRPRTNTTDWRQSMVSLRPDHTLIRATWWVLAITQNRHSTTQTSEHPRTTMPPQRFDVDGQELQARRQ